MKIHSYLLATAMMLMAAACGKSGSGGHEHHVATDDPNQALYNQVMDIHDEVMPKSEDIFNLKKELDQKLEKAAEADQARLKSVIHELDSADHAMMEWMHQFKPKTDTTNREANREYLEDQMEKIRKVAELINGSIQKAKDELGKK